MKEDILKRLLKTQHGVFRAKDAEAAGISRQTLGRLVQKGQLYRISHGQYIASGDLPDALFAIQQRSRYLIYSHETALYLHGLTDRTPFLYTATVPHSYKASDTIRLQCRIFYISKEFHRLGAIEMDTKMGHRVTAYDVERTLCDMVRSRNQLDEQLVLEAVKRYVALSVMDLNRLYNYAEKLRIQSVIRRYLEVLL